MEEGSLEDWSMYNSQNSGTNSWLIGLFSQSDFEQARLKKIGTKKLVRTQWALNLGPPCASQVRNVHDHPDRLGMCDKKGRVMFLMN